MGVDSLEFAINESVAEDFACGFGAVSVVPVRVSDPVTHFGVVVGLVEGETDRADEFFSGFQCDCEVGVFVFGECGGVGVDPFFGCAVGVGVRDEEGGVCDLGCAGESLHVRRIVEGERAEDESLSDKGGDLVLRLRLHDAVMVWRI